MTSVERESTETTLPVPECVDLAAAPVPGKTGDIVPQTKITEDSRKPERRTTRYRKIPRSPPEDKQHNADKVLTGSNLPKAPERRRTSSASSATSGRGWHRRGGRNNHRRRTNSEVSTVPGLAEPLQQLLVTVKEKYDRKGFNMLNSYIKNRMELAKYENTASFLERCDSLRVVPPNHRLSNNNIKNTKQVKSTLDRSSERIVLADLKYNRMRRSQVSELLAEKEQMMKELFGEDDAELLSSIFKAAGDEFERRSERIREQQAKVFDSLLQEYNITEEEKAEAEKYLQRKKEHEKAYQERLALRKASARQRVQSEDAESKVGGDESGDKEPKSDVAQPAEDAPAPKVEESAAATTADKQEDKQQGDAAEE